MQPLVIGPAEFLKQLRMRLCALAFLGGPAYMLRKLVGTTDQNGTKYGDNAMSMLVLLVVM